MGIPLTGRRLSIYYSSAPPGFFVREARFANRQFVSHSFFVPPDFPLYSLLRSQRDPGHHFLCREKVTKSGRGARAEGLLGQARPFGAGRPSRGDQSPHVPPCPPGGINLRNGVEQIASQRGLPRPRSIFGHFLLIKKVATPASGFCLTISQTTVLPMAQAKNIPAVQPEQR